jgi:hypothetical protein
MSGFSILPAILAECLACVIAIPVASRPSKTVSLHEGCGCVLTINEIVSLTHLPDLISTVVAPIFNHCTSRP